MNLEIEESGPVERRLRIEVPIAEVDAAFDRVYRKLQKKSRVRGFRPGKAPRSVMERYFSEQAQSDVFEVVVGESLRQALEESSLPIISEPKLEPEGLPKQGAAFAYQATVEIRPEIDLQKTRGLSVSAPAPPEPEQDPVEAHLEQLRFQHATLTDAEDGAQASQGHVAVVHYAGTIDGEPFPGGEGRDVEFEIGSGRSLPGFEEALVGLRVGEDKEFDLDVPEDDGREQIAGKQIHFRIELAALKRRELAPLDDEFAKDYSDFDTLDAWKADLGERVQKGREAEKTRRLREATVDAVIAANPFPVPPSLVEQRLSARMSQAVQRLRGRVPDDTLREMVQGWSEEWRPAAERDVRMSFLVGAIASAESFTISDEDYDARLREIAEDSGRPLASVQRECREHGISEAIRLGLLEDRVIDFLLAEATVSEA